MRLRGHRAAKIGVSALCASFALLSCGSESQASLPAPPTIKSLSELTRALSDSGVPMVEIEPSPIDEFGVPGRRFLVGSSEIHAFEFQSEQEQRARYEAIDPSGYAVGGVPIAWTGRPNIWSAGRLLVVYPGSDGGTILLLSGLLGDPFAAIEPDIDEPYPPAILAAIGAAAEATGSSPEDVQVIEYEFKEWPNSCLGLPGPDEMCAQAIVPGWLVRLNAGGDQIVFRADEVGAELRQE